MAGELHTPPDDGAGARAEAVVSERVRADALADRIADYAPAGSDARWQSVVHFDTRALRAEAEVARLREALGRIAGCAASRPAKIARKALDMDPECSLCQAGHVPAQPCGHMLVAHRAEVESQFLKEGSTAHCSCGWDADGEVFGSTALAHEAVRRHHSDVLA